MTVRADTVHRRRVRDPLSPRAFGPWFGLFGPALAWGVHLVLGDLIFELGCGPATMGRLFGISVEVWAIIQTATTLVVAVAGGLAALAAWRTVRRAADGVRWDRAHALALGGLASGAIFSLLIAWEFLAPLYLSACGYSP